MIIIDEFQQLIHQTSFYSFIEFNHFKMQTLINNLTIKNQIKLIINKNLI